MQALVLTRTLDSETLHLPELRPFLGHHVEITVRESPVTDPQVREAGSVQASLVDAASPAVPPIWEQFSQTLAALPASALANLPTDGAERHDDYIRQSVERHG